MPFDPTCITDELMINMGPQHPSTHGVLRLVLTIDGEKVLSVVPTSATCIRRWRR